MELLKSIYRKTIYILIFFCTSLVFSGYFIDYNFLPRFGLFLILVLLWIPGLKNNKIYIDEAFLLLFYLYNYIACFWANQFDFAFLETQRVGIYFVSYFMAKRVIELWGLNWLIRLVVVTSIVVVLVNFGLLAVIGIDTSTTAGHPNLLSSFLLLALPFSIHQMCQKENEKKWRISGIIGFVLILSIIGLLHTRSVWLGLFVFFALLIYHYVRRKRSKKWLIFYFISLLLIVATSLTMLFLTDIFDLTSFRERFFIWGKTLGLITESPFIGVGPGNWLFNYTKFGISDFETFKYYGLLMERPHNDLLWLLSELGIIGVIILSLFFWKTLRAAFTAPFSRTKIIFTSGFISFLPVILLSFPKERVEHLLLFFTLLAVIASLSLKKNTIVFKKGGKLVVGLLLIPAFIMVYYQSVGNLYTKKIMAAEEKGDFKSVLLYAKKAESPFYLHTPKGLPIASYEALSYYKLNQIDALYYYSRRAYFRSPFNYEVLTNFGAALNAVKNFDLAERVLLEAHRINNVYDGAIFNLAFVYYNKGDYKNAKLWIDRVDYESEKTEYFSGLIHDKLNQPKGND
jgi:O-antigen ligase